MQSPSFPPHLPFPARARGFSLVEVVMALGIMSFALMGIVGLLPAGLSQFRQAVDVTVKAQISQELTAMVQRTDYAKLSDFGDQGSPRISYYDSEGALLTANAEGTYAYMAKTYRTTDADLGHLLAPTWSKPLTNVSAVKIAITSRTSPDRPHNSISYVANTGL
jgi:uncharacterized protein (TIGR02598 family)